MDILKKAVDLSREIRPKQVRLQVICLDCDVGVVESEVSRRVGLEGIKVWPISTRGSNGPDEVGGQITERILHCLIDNVLWRVDALKNHSETC